MFLKLPTLLLALTLPFLGVPISAEDVEEPNCPFGLTANDIAARSGLDLSGKVALVTGGRSGLGYSISEALLLLNCTVVIASRNELRNQAAVESLKEIIPGASVSYMTFDLEEFASVRSFASAFIGNHSRLDYYFANAGQSTPVPQPLTVDGFERVFQVNYVSQFLLVQLLLPLLRSTLSSRILLTASFTHQWACAALGLGNHEDEPACFGDSLPFNDSAFLRLPIDKEGLNFLQSSDAFSLCPVELRLGTYPTTKYLMLQLGLEISAREAAAGNEVYAYSWAPGAMRTALWPYATCCTEPLGIPGTCGGELPYWGPTDTLGNPDPPAYDVPNFWTSPMHGTMAPIYAALRSDPSEAGSFFATYWNCAANNTVGYRNQGITERGRAQLYEQSMTWAGLDKSESVVEKKSEDTITAKEDGNVYVEEHDISGAMSLMKSSMMFLFSIVAVGVVAI